LATYRLKIGPQFLQKAAKRTKRWGSDRFSIFFILSCGESADKEEAHQAMDAMKRSLADIRHVLQWDSATAFHQQRNQLFRPTQIMLVCFFALFCDNSIYEFHKSL